ncbi:MAG: 16S rRNA (cytosine(1402)-N(4))-methyltransferase RsmH [Sedimentisphaerales bacterium]|nr:16S rRNA (cytosine(1402)-N(4))-methyltransferase RsmH [Sedimentisphaerales bacterium]
MPRHADPDQTRHRRRGRGTIVGTHIPVMPRQVVEVLRPQDAKVVVDCTIGYGGHALSILRLMPQDAVFIGLDVDGPQLQRTAERLKGLGKDVRLHRCNFSQLPEILAKEGLDKVDVIFADLGASSMQIDDPKRGFSYKHPDSPLDMRMDDRLGTTAADLLLNLSEEELDRALWELADEPDHQRIAQFIVAQRAVKPITTTSELIRLIFAAKGTSQKAWLKKKTYHDPHPAALTFQALRIMVNNELENLRRLLDIAPGLLNSGGRIAIISFQRGEDMIVRTAFRAGLEQGIYKAICPKAIRPTINEIRSNPRSSSGRLRWAIRA